VVDLEVNPDIGGSSSVRVNSTDIPPMPTHGSLHSFCLGRKAVANEHLVFMGLPAYPRHEKLLRARWPWRATAEHLSRAQIVKLAGNGQHFILVVLQLAYVLSHVQEVVSEPPGSEFEADCVGA
jgi:hypothetical protein